MVSGELIRDIRQLSWVDWEGTRTGSRRRGSEIRVEGFGRWGFSGFKGHMRLGSSRPAFRAKVPRTTMTTSLKLGVAVSRV